MKLFFSPASPFVRKVMVVAHEVGLADRIERLTSKAHPVDRDPAIREHNPLGQVPTLVTDDGVALYDSRVICEYLDALGDGGLFGTGQDRWQALTLQALADGLMAAAVLIRYEAAVRPEALRWSDWTSGQMGKVTDALGAFEASLPGTGGRTDIGTIAAGCALGYLDFRFADLNWRRAQPRGSGLVRGGERTSRHDGDGSARVSRVGPCRYDWRNAHAAVRQSRPPRAATSAAIAASPSPR